MATRWERELEEVEQVLKNEFRYDKAQEMSIIQMLEELIANEEINAVIDGEYLIVKIHVF